MDVLAALSLSYDYTTALFHQHIVYQNLVTDCSLLYSNTMMRTLMASIAAAVLMGQRVRSIESPWLS